MGGRGLRVTTCQTTACAQIDAKLCQSVLEIDLSLSDSDEEVAPIICAYFIDWERLEDGKFLNDTLVDVTLAWLAYQELINGRRASTTICSSHLQLIHELRSNFERVSRWYPDGGPFSTGVAFIPVCDNDHWLLVAVVTDFTADPVETIVSLIRTR